MSVAKTIVVWVCPREDCTNYYGSSSQAAIDLTAEANHESDLSHKSTHEPFNARVVGNRGECPDCKTQGRGRVQRVRVPLIVQVDPADQPVPPPHADAAAWALANPEK